VIRGSNQQNQSPVIRSCTNLQRKLQVDLTNVDSNKTYSRAREVASTPASNSREWQHYQLLRNALLSPNLHTYQFYDLTNWRVQGCQDAAWMTVAAQLSGAGIMCWSSSLAMRAQPLPPTPIQPVSGPRCPGRSSLFVVKKSATRGSCARARSAYASIQAASTSLLLL
jgi:hypothetical protein